MKAVAVFLAVLLAPAFAAASTGLVEVSAAQEIPDGARVRMDWRGTAALVSDVAERSDGVVVAMADARLGINCVFVNLNPPGVGFVCPLPPLPHASLGGNVEGDGFLVLG